MAPQTQVRRIVVEVDARDSDGKLRVLQRGFAGLNQNIRGTTSAVTSFRNAFLALQGLNFAGFGIGSLVNTVDEVQRLNNRLNLTEGSAENASRAFASLTEVANENLSSVTDIVSVYSRLNAALKDTGISSQALIGLTDTLQKTFRISGSSAQEASATTIQLSQALASGELRGEELRSVLEQNALAGELLAKRFGIARGEILKFSDARGGIKTVEFLEALSQSFDDINVRAANLSPTIGDTLTANFNRLKVGLSELNTEFELTRRVSGLINTAFKNLDIAAALITIAAAYKGYAVAAGLATTAQLAFNSSLLALVANPVVGFIVKAGTVIGGLAVTAAGATVAIVGLTTAFVSALALSDSFRESVKGLIVNTAQFIRLSASTKEYKEQVEAQRKALSDLEKQNVINTKIQTEWGNSLDRTFKTMLTGQQEVLVLTDTNRGLSLTYVEQVENITAAQKALRDFAKFLQGSQKVTFDYQATLAALNEKFLADRNINSYNQALKKLEIAKLNVDFKKGSINLEEYNKRLREIEFGKVVNRAQELRNDFAELNKEFGQFGNVEEYARRLNTLTFERNVQDFKEGRTNLLDFNKALTDRAIDTYNQRLAEGAITLEAYTRGVEGLQLRQLEQSFKSGTISIFEYNQQLTELGEKFNPGSALFTGTANYIRQAGTISQNIANGITQTFGRVEEFFTEFTKTGRFNFREFAAGVIDDLNRIIVRALIIRPLAQGILGAIGGGGGAAAASAPAQGGFQSSFGFGDFSFQKNGGAFNSGVQYFAKGGVVNRATMFGMKNGMGVMGEAGPEAILPLRRTSSGDLGVKAESAPANVFVNIINQSGNAVEQRESTNANGDRVIEILVLSTVKEGIASGAFDRQFSQTFGLSRRGA